MSPPRPSAIPAAVEILREGVAGAHAQCGEGDERRHDGDAQEHREGYEEAHRSAPQAPADALVHADVVDERPHAVTAGDDDPDCAGNGVELGHQAACWPGFSRRSSAASTFRSVPSFGSTVPSRQRHQVVAATPASRRTEAIFTPASLARCSIAVI